MSMGGSLRKLLQEKKFILSMGIETAVHAKIVRLVPRRLLERVVRGQAGESGGGCHKCGSLFVEIEPAFIHCRYCGSLSRIHGASLLAQEEWEQRSGMRLAS